MNRERILCSALSMFLRQGIKGTTMDNLACELGISKRTLYSLFPNKELLLQECLTINQAKQELFTVSQATTVASDIMQIITGIYRYVQQTSCEVNILCFRDIAHRFPSIFDKIRLRIDQQLNLIDQKIREGQQQGLIRTGINPEVVNLFFHHHLYTLFSGYHSDTHNSGYADIIPIFVHGIATPKGVERLNEVIAHR